jgi:RNA polymerase sigma factor (sigma-70 family)
MRPWGDEVTDDILVGAARRGDRSAFGALYERYSPVARRFARGLIGSDEDADDLVAEAFAKVLRRLAAGAGPTRMFSSYLLTTVRTTYYKQLAGDRMVDRQVTLVELDMAETDSLAPCDAHLVARAFRGLSPRWQAVLWHLDVENRSIAEVAGQMGILPNAVTALALRARVALRVGYLQMHVNTNVPAACDESATNLAAWICGRLQRGMRIRIEQHVECCAACEDAAEELTDLAAGLDRPAPSPRNGRSPHSYRRVDHRYVPTFSRPLPHDQARPP